MARGRRRGGLGRACSAQLQAIDGAGGRLFGTLGGAIKPALETLKARARRHAREIEPLDRAFSGEGGLMLADPNATASTPAPDAKPAATAVKDHPSWGVLLDAANADPRLCDRDRRVLGDLVGRRDRATGRTSASRAAVALGLQIPEVDVATSTVTLRTYGYIRWERQARPLPNLYEFLAQKPPAA